jgi:hypothetical protein
VMYNSHVYYVDKSDDLVVVGLFAVT